MLYKKPANMKYVDMAIYIDEHVRDENADMSLIFSYMWQLFYILAYKKGMFQNPKDYEEYALYGATQLLLRYEKEKISPSLTPIKSSLNYIKRLLYPFKVNYQKATFAQIFKEESLNEQPLAIRDNEIRKARSSEDSFIEVESTYYLSQLPKTIKYLISDSPYVNDKATFSNIYLSCLLTLLKKFTMSRVSLEKLQSREEKGTSVLKLIDKIYQEEEKDNVVVYHLDPSMANYISTLVNRCRKEIVKDLRIIVGSHELSDAIVKDILAQPAIDLLELRERYEDAQD